MLYPCSSVYSFVKRIIVFFFLCVCVCVVCVLCVVFFFQAEDGIRDLVRSRGLGDVYKRQDPERTFELTQLFATKFIEESKATKERESREAFEFIEGQVEDYHAKPVSYTHLTLPTSDLV